MKNKYKIGIIGLGVVGSQFKRWFEEENGYERGIDLFLYDIASSKGYLDDINNAEVIFLCVPTPSLKDGSINLSLIDSAFKKINGNKIIIIKSTVLPGTTEQFQKDYKQHKILFSPEFLTEKNAWGDFNKPKRQIVGFTEENLDIAHKILAILPQAPFMSPNDNALQPTKITATEAEMIKYGGNIFIARKINFSNIIALLSEKVGADYENVQMGIAADNRIGGSHLDVLHGGYKGFGGCCIPKDFNAFICSLKSFGLDECTGLLEKDREFNEKLIATQGLTIEEVSVCTFKNKSGDRKLKNSDGRIGQVE